MLPNQMFNAVLSSLRTFDPLSDTLDILIISFVFYQLLQFARKSRAGQLVKGIILILVFYGLAVMLNLKTVTWVLNNVITIGFMAAVVIFLMFSALDLIVTNSLIIFSISGVVYFIRCIPRLWSERSRPDWALLEPDELMNHDAIFGMDSIMPVVTTSRLVPMMNIPASRPPFVMSLQTALK